MKLFHCFVILLSVVSLCGCEPAAAPYVDTAPGCKLVVDASFPVIYAFHHSPVVVVSIQGQKLKMLVDSGSFDSDISVPSFNRLKDKLHYNTDIHTSGLGGEDTTKYMSFQNLAFGGIYLHSEVLGISDGRISFTNGHPDFDGVMGSDILEHFDVGLDLPDNRITLYAQQNCGTPVIPWIGSYAPVPFQETYDGLRFITVLVDDKPMSLVLDTGADVTMLYQSAIDRMKLKPEALSAGAPSFGIDSSSRLFIYRLVEFRNITIGGEEFDDEWTTLYKDNKLVNPDSIDGLLGEDYYATHRVYIDNATNVAYFGLAAQ